MNRRYLMAGSYAPARAKRYVTVTIYANVPWQYFDGTEKTFQYDFTYIAVPWGGTVSLNTTPEVITATLPGSYPFHHTSADFIYIPPDNNYDYYATINVQTGGATIKDGNIIDAYYNTSKLYVDDTLQSSSSSIYNGNITNQYMSSLANASFQGFTGNITNNTKVDSITTGDVIGISIHTMYKNMLKTILTFTEDNVDTTYSIKNAVYNNLLKPVVVMYSYKDTISVTSGNILYFYDLYNGGYTYLNGVQGSTRPTSYYTNLTIFFTVQSTTAQLTKIYVQKGDSNTAPTIAIRNFGNHLIETGDTWRDRINTRNMTIDSYSNHISINDNIYTSNHNGYGNLRNNAVKLQYICAPGDIQSLTGHISTVNNYRTPTYDILETFPSGVTNKVVELTISSQANRSTAYWIFGRVEVKHNNTWYSLKSAVQQGYIQPIVLINVTLSNYVTYTTMDTQWPNALYATSSSLGQINHTAEDSTCSCVITFTINTGITGVRCVHDNSSDMSSLYSSCATTDATNYQMTYVE